MNSSSLFILDTFRISQRENDFLSFHIQRTLEAIQIYHPAVKLEDLSKIYEPFRLVTSNHDQKCRLVIDPQTISLIESEITAIDLLNDEIKLEFATQKNQKAGLGIQNYKTTDRSYWENNIKFKRPDSDDIIGINYLNQVTETSRFNLFIKRQDLVFTPTLHSGCVNGCLRRLVLKNGFIEINQKKYKVSEKDFTVNDLKNADLYVGNSLRGITKAVLAIN
jgi:hypothetical protein